MAGVSKVLVVGAGVGGMTLARTMRHLKMDVKVFDRAHDRHAQANRGLGLWDNSQVRKRPACSSCCRTPVVGMLGPS